MAQKWSFVAAGAFVNNTSPTVAVPAGYAADDILVMCMVTTGSITTPSGWTAVANNGQLASIFYKTASASESNITVTTSVQTSAVMLCYRGLYAFDSTSTRNTATGTTATTNTLTTTQPDDLVISLFGVSISANGPSFSVPTGTTSRAAQTGSLSVFGVLVADEDQATAGTSTSRSSTISAAGLSWATLAVSFVQTAGSTMLVMF